MDLQESRKQIDKIDKEIVRLFEKRMALAGEVASYKIETGKPVYDPEREREKLAALENMTEDAFNRHGIRELFTQIMAMSRKLQYKRMAEHTEGAGFRAVKRLNLEGKRIAYFGARASYSEQAMEEYFGTDADSFPVPSFRGVMEAVRKGEAAYGVLPIENTSTGGIADIYDLLAGYDSCIIGEHVVKVDQALLGLPGAGFSDIRSVYSHPQGLLQCAGFLEGNPQLRAFAYASTSGSAEKVLKDGDITQGAIASERAAGYYGLEVIKSHINTEKNNQTRFIIITGEKLFFEDAEKISISFLLPHESGSLYNMLSHMIYNNLNMTKIESRPIPERSFEYRFFADFEGNLKEAGVKNALLGMAAEAHELSILGNYKIQ